MLLLGNDFICKLLSSDGLSGNFMSKNGWFCLFLVGGERSRLPLLSLLLETKLRYI